MVKFRAERNWITLVGRWKLPGRTRTEYYWSRLPMGVRFVPHQAGLANACSPYFPFAEFSSPVIRVGADTLLTDKLMMMGGVNYLVEYDNHGQESQTFLSKKLALYRAHFLSLAQPELERTALLFVTSCGERRVNNLIEKARQLSLPNVCAAPLADVRDNPWGEIWSIPESDQKLALCKPALQSITTDSMPETSVSQEIASLSAN